MDPDQIVTRVQTISQTGKQNKACSRQNSGRTREQRTSKRVLTNSMSSECQDAAIPVKQALCDRD